MANSSNILIIDRSTESSEILCELLERSGCQTTSVRAASEAVSSRGNTGDSDLILIDFETVSNRRDENLRKLCENADRTNTPIVVIGSSKRQEREIPGGSHIAKPYHYRDLLRKIEYILGDAA